MFGKPLSRRYSALATVTYATALSVPYVFTGYAVPRASLVRLGGIETRLQLHLPNPDGMQ